MSKYIVHFGIGGGFDAVNFLSPTDTTSVARVQALRAGAPSNVLNYVLPTTVTVTLTSNSKVVTMASTTGILAGWKVYGAVVSGVTTDTSHLPATRKITVATVDSATQITMTDVFIGTTGSYPVFFGKVATPGTQTKDDALYPIYEPTSSTRFPALHFTQNFLYDKMNVTNIPANASKTKVALISNVGALRKPLSLNGNGGLINNFTGLSVNESLDVPISLTSHNDQYSTVQSNGPEGSIKGWGGGIADAYIGSLSSNMAPLATVSTANFPPFTAGDIARSFNVGNNGLIFKLPNYYGQYTRDTAVSISDQNTLIGILKLAATTPPVNNNIATAATMATNLSVSYQDILGSVSNITDPPAIVFNIDGSKAINGADGAGRLKSVIRMIHANNPNRGATVTRSGTTATFVTEVGTGLASRVGNVVTVTAVGHRLFTSGVKGPVNLSDSVLVTGVDATPVTDGYKITIDPLTPNDKFSFTSTDSGTLTNVSITFQLKHNLTNANLVYIANTTETFDTGTIPSNGYAVTVISQTSFSVPTTATVAFTGGGTNPAGTMSAKFKLLNLPNQVIYTESGMPLDSHSEATHSQLAGIDALLTYYDSLISRIVDADVVTFSLSEFGRTLSTNSNGTDHGWGCTHFVFGKSVKGNAFYGDMMDYRAPVVNGGNPALQSVGGQHLNSGMFMPTTSIYQYGATMARWMGTTDAQVLALFPDLKNWDTLGISRYLGFL